MIEVRTKDIVFISFALPLAVAALYFYFWRNASSARYAALEKELSTLVAEDDFDFEMSKIRRAVEGARAERDAEKSLASPESCIKADKVESEAERVRALSDVFISSSLRVVRCVKAECDKNIAAQLTAAGVRQAPAARCWELEGAYSDVIRALDKINSAKKAAIPVSVSFAPPSLISITIVF